MERRIALVTGANKGIGLETVRQLAGQGIQTVLASRDPGRGQDAARSLAACHPPRTARFVVACSTPMPSTRSWA